MNKYFVLILLALSIVGCANKKNIKPNDKVAVSKKKDDIAKIETLKESENIKEDKVNKKIEKLEPKVEDKTTPKKELEAKKEKKEEVETKAKTEKTESKPQIKAEAKAKQKNEVEKKIKSDEKIYRMVTSNAEVFIYKGRYNSKPFDDRNLKEPFYIKSGLVKIEKIYTSQNGDKYGKLTGKNFFVSMDDLKIKE